MKFFILFLVSVASLRPAYRAAAHLLRPQPIRSLHTPPVFPWIAGPGKRFVELVLLSGDRKVGELDENMTMKHLKKIAMDQFKYRDVFETDQVDFVGRLLYGPIRSESRHIIAITDSTKLVEVAPPIGSLLQLSVVSRVLPDAGRYSFLMLGIESGSLRFERLKVPRYRWTTRIPTITPNITTDTR